MITKEELQSLYVVEKLSDQKIADRIGMKRRDVTRLRQSYGVVAIEDFERLPHHDLTQIEKSILIGLMLGDGHMRRRGKSKAYPELMIEQSMKHEEYVKWLRVELSKWIYDQSKPLKENTKYSKVTDSYNKSIGFRTVSHPVFNEFYNAFYPEGSKIVSFEILDKYFNEMSLAVWIMDDGGLTGSRPRTRLCTNGFTKEEVDALGQFLMNKYGLKTWTCEQPTKKSMTWELHFDKESSLKITSLIQDIVAPSMQYKLFRES